jgi:hypothetical protein
MCEVGEVAIPRLLNGELRVGCSARLISTKERFGGARLGMSDAVAVVVPDGAVLDGGPETAIEKVVRAAAAIHEGIVLTVAINRKVLDPDPFERECPWFLPIWADSRAGYTASLPAAPGRL